MQHATFTGADVEVTFDTSKKVLVVHDGVTAGGKPVDGFVKLDPGAPLSLQEIKTCVSISGGDSDTDAFTVSNPSHFTAQVIVDDTMLARRLQLQSEVLAYASSLDLNFATFGQKRIDLTGNLSLTSNNMDYGKSLLLRIAADGSVRTLAFPAGWRWVGGTAPANIAANKLALLRLECFGTVEASVVARYLVEP